MLAALTLVVAGLLAPLVGALADRGDRRLDVLTATTVVCCSATVTIPLAGRGELWLAAAAMPSTFVFGHLADLWEIRKTVYLQIVMRSYSGSTQSREGCPPRWVR